MGGWFQWSSMISRGVVSPISRQLHKMLKLLSVFASSWKATLQVSTTSVFGHCTCSILTAACFALFPDHPSETPRSAARRNLMGTSRCSGAHTIESRGYWAFVWRLLVENVLLGPTGVTVRWGIGYVPSIE